MTYAKQNADWESGDPVTEANFDAWETAIYELKTDVANVKDYGAAGDGSTADTAAINTALTALDSTNGILVFPVSTGAYVTAGGHTIPPGVTVIGGGPGAPPGAVTVDHTGDNACFEYNDNSYQHRIGGGIRSVTIDGNSGSNACAIEVSDAFGFDITDVTVKSYTNGTALYLHNVDQWTEGTVVRSFHSHLNLTGIKFQRELGASSSFGYTKIFDAMINVPASGFGIDVGGSVASESSIYNSDISVHVWLEGDDATGIRVRSPALMQHNRYWIRGEPGGAATGLVGIQVDSGATMTGFGTAVFAAVDDSVAGTFSMAGQLQEQHVIHVVGAAGEPAYQNSWANFAAGWADAGFYRDGAGVGHLLGLVKSGTVPSVVFTLPSWCRPEEAEMFPVCSNDDFGRVKVANNGEVKVEEGNNTYVSLSGISFRLADV